LVAEEMQYMRYHETLAIETILRIYEDESI